MKRTMRLQRDRRALMATVLVVTSLLTVSAAGAGQHQRTWHLTNNLEVHETSEGTVFGPGHAMYEDGGNGTFPTGHMLVMSASTFGTRVWSASPVVSGESFGKRSWTISFGGESVVTDLRFVVGSYDYRTGVFDDAAGDPGIIDLERTGTFTPSAAFVVPQGRELGLRVWVPRGSTSTPSLLDVWDPVTGVSPSTLTLS